MGSRMLVGTKRTQHLRKQFHRQSDDIGRAAFQEMDPIESILKAERASFSLPCATVQIALQFRITDGVHS